MTTDHAPSPDGFELFDHYEKRFSRAVADLPARFPWDDCQRDEILTRLCEIVGVRSEWVPEVVPRRVSVIQEDGYHVEQLQAETWPGCRSAADLYLPGSESGVSERLPTVLLACGHGKEGKRSASYRGMAASLARHGFAVLVPDNIGQGEREPMGHANVVGVFASGLSLQGLIVMETMGWLDWVRGASPFDPARIALIGNSGGGLLSLLVGALRRDHLAAVSSSGYPSTFEFIARKEKKHCHCNLLPGIVGELEMWQIYGCIAPKPLFLFQGMGDPLFPPDLFWQNARKVAAVYERRSAAAQFQAEVYPGSHPWDIGRRHALVHRLCGQFGLPYEEARVAGELPEHPLPLCFPHDTFSSKNADELAAALSGVTSSARHLSDIYCPSVSLPADGVPPCARGSLRQIFAQFEAFLK